MEKCKRCGAEYVKTHIAKLYCSTECSGKAKAGRRAKVVSEKRKAKLGDKKCPACCKMFKARNGAQVYCSLECRNKPKPSCKYCGENFRDGTKKKYCSESCRLDHYRVLKSMRFKLIAKSVVKVSSQCVVMQFIAANVALIEPSMIGIRC